MFKGHQKRRNETSWMLTYAVVLKRELIAELVTRPEGTRVPE